MRFITRTLKYAFIKKKNRNEYLINLFVDFQKIAENNFGYDFVEFIESKSTKELIYLLLKCKEYEPSNISIHDACKIIAVESLPQLKDNLNDDEIKEYKELIYKSYGDGLKEPSRFSSMLTAEINRRNQNSILLTTFILIVVTITISIISSVLSLKQISTGDEIRILQKEINLLKYEKKKK